MSRNRRKPRPKTGDTVRAIAGAPRTYTFEWKGRRYTMPPADQNVANVPAGLVIDALTGADSQTAELRLGIAYIQAANIDADAMAALRDMPIKTFGEHVGKWMRAAGVRPGESERSST